MQWLDLLRTAETLAQLPNASQSDMNRAVSTAYYAAFHALCKTCADCIAGIDGHLSSNEAWQQVYRSLDHGFVKRQCLNYARMEELSPEVQNFAGGHVHLHGLRNRADYDPSFNADQELAEEVITTAKNAIDALNSAPEKDRHAFAIWTTHKNRTLYWH